MTDDCEHESVVTYTVRDWWETGLSPGTVCEDCGHQFTAAELVDLDTRDFEQMAEDRAERRRRDYP